MHRPRQAHLSGEGCAHECRHLPDPGRVYGLQCVFLLWATCVRKRGDRFAAHEPVAQAVNRGFGVSAPDAADGVELRHDHSSQYLTDYSQDRTFQ